MSNVMPLTEAPRYAVWDFDGTLAIREGLWSQCLADVMFAHVPGARTPREAFVPYIQRGFPWHSPEQHRSHTSPESWWAALSPTLELAFQGAGAVSAVLAKQLAGKVQAAYLQPQAWCVFADVAPCLVRLQASGWHHVILSNHVPELPALVAALGLQQYFSHVFTSGLSGFEKPHPGAFEQVEAALPKGAELVMVGDNYAAAVLGAEAVGWRAILVRQAKNQASEFASTLAQLPSVLEAHNPSIERTASSQLRWLPAAAHVER